MLKVVLFTLFLSSVSSYRILGIFPHAGKSHYDVFEPLFKALSQKGHSVTIVSHFPQKTKIPNFTDVSLVGTTEILLNFIPFGMFPTGILGRILHVVDLARITNPSCETAFKSKALNEFLRAKPQFDIVMTEHFTTNCFLGVLHHMNASLIGMTSGGMISWVNDYMGQPDNPAYIPSLFVGLADRLTFFERLENSVAYVVNRVLYKYLIDMPSNRDARKYIDKDLPDLNEFAYNTRLVLTNIHFTLHRPKPYVPNVIEVGGMHIGKQKPLPQE